MICASCGTLNPAGQKFCGECASPLAAACPSCGTRAAPGQKFCGECAAPLTAPQDASPLSRPQIVAPAPVAERRLVTVLFADIVGFTPFAADRDAEEVRETLSRYFDIAGEIVARYGGTVEKFIGDAVMAVWGTPAAREDDAERAVRAGLDLVDAVRVLGEGVSARAGVLTGEAAVTLGATNQGMVAGDLVNTAARLQSVAQPGSVLVGETTQRAASSAIAFEPAGPQLLKGKDAPVQAWVALRVVAERGGRGRSGSLEAPFVGRDDELRLLKDLFHATARERRPRLVSVSGIGGIGKSRLAWEFEKYLDGIVDVVWWHHGRSPAYGEGITFWPLGEMIRARAGVLEGDDEATTREGLGQFLDRMSLAAEERSWIEAALLAVLGYGSGVGSEQLFGAWRMFFERLGETGTVVLVFEDLHWADSGTLDFIEHLLDWSRSTPIYILTLARPELLERRPDWGAGRRNYTSLALEPLSEPAMRSLLAGLVPGLPEQAVRAIVARAEGVPLYAVETVRMLVAEGRLVAAGDGSHEPRGDLADLAVPESLTALIAARLDALDPADRALLLDAAVLGQSFPVAGLAAVAGVDELSLEPRLRSLVRRELLVQHADPRSPDRGQYAFVQALIREVAYNTLARRDRKARHLAAARYFEALGSDEIAGALAGHYLAAHDLAQEPAEAEALAAQARLALVGAAERARALGSHEQVVGFLTSALRVTTDQHERAGMLREAAAAAVLAGRPDDAQELFASAVAEYRAVGDLRGLARAAAGMGASLTKQYRPDEALSLLRGAIEEAAGLGDGPESVELALGIARAEYYRDDHDAALAALDDVLRRAERQELVAVAAEALHLRGSVLCEIGRSWEGVAVIEGAQRLAEAHGVDVIAYQAVAAEALALSATDPVLARDLLLQSIADARRRGDRSMLVRSAHNAAELWLLLGDWEAAEQMLDEVLADDLLGIDRVFHLNLRVALASSRGSDTAGLLAQIDELVPEDADPNLRAVGVEAHSYARLAAGDFASARAGFRTAAAMSPLNAPRFAMWIGMCSSLLRDVPGLGDDLAALDRTGAHGSAITVHRLEMQAAIEAIEGRVDVARGLYRDAQGRLEAMRLGFELPLMVLAAGATLGPADEYVAAQAPAARASLQALGAAAILALLDAQVAPTTQAVRSA